MSAWWLSRFNSCEISEEQTKCFHFWKLHLHVDLETSYRDWNLLPQLLQVTNGFFLTSILQFEVGRFSYECQVSSRSGLWRRRTDWLHRRNIQISQTTSVFPFSLLWLPSKHKRQWFFFLKHELRALHTFFIHCGVMVLWDTNLFRLVMPNSLFENVNSTVNVLLVGVHRYQSWNLRSQKHS